MDLKQEQILGVLDRMMVLSVNLKALKKDAELLDDSPLTSSLEEIMRILDRMDVDAGILTDLVSPEWDRLTHIQMNELFSRGGGRLA